MLKRYGCWRIYMVIFTLIASCSSDEGEGGFDLGESSDLSRPDSGDLFDMDKGIPDLGDGDADRRDMNPGRTMVRFVSARSDYVIETALLEFPDSEHPDIELAPNSIPEWREVSAGEFDWIYTDRNGADYIVRQTLEAGTHVTFVEYGFTPLPTGMTVTPHARDSFGFAAVPGFRDDGFGPTKDLTIVNSDPFHQRIDRIHVDGTLVPEFSRIGWGKASAKATLSSEPQVFEIFYPDGDVSSFWLEGVYSAQHAVVALTNRVVDDGSLGEIEGFLRAHAWGQQPATHRWNPKPERVQIANLTPDEIEFGYNSDRMWSVSSNSMIDERPLFPRKGGESVSLILNTSSGDSFVDVQLTEGPQLLIYTDDGFVRSPRRAAARVGGAGVILYNATDATLDAGGEQVPATEFATFDDAMGDFQILAGTDSYSRDLAAHAGEVLMMIVTGNDSNGYEVFIGFADSTERHPLL